MACYIILNSDGRIHTVSEKDDNVLQSGQTKEISELSMQEFIESLPSEPSDCVRIDGSYIAERAQEPKRYSPKRFLASCALDETMRAITAKMSDRQYFDFAACLQNGNFEVLALLAGQMLSAEIITSDDLSYFSTKLLNEEGVSL